MKAVAERRKRYAPGCVRFDKRRGTWHYLFYEGVARRSRRIGTKQEYPTKAAAWNAVNGLGLEQEKAQQLGETVGSLIDRYEAERMPERHSTARVYRSFLKCHIRPKWGTTLVEDVQPRPVELWLKELPLAPKSKTHVRSLMHGLVEFAMYAGFLTIGRNPISLVQNKGATRRTRTPRSLTAEQFQALMRELREPFATIGLLSVCLGLRVSEALALTWADLDYKAGRLNVHRGIVNQRVADVKTQASARTFTLTPAMLTRLRDLESLCNFPEPSAWMFASPVQHGRLPYSYTAVWRELQRAALAAGVGTVGTHAFRHTYRSWLDAVGTTVAVQQKLMRHSDVRTTMNIYGDVVTDEMDTAAAKVSGIAFMANGAQTERGLI